MKKMILPLLLGISAFCRASDSNGSVTMEGLLASAKPVADTDPVRRVAKVVVGEPTSSLTMDQARSLAQQMATCIKGAGVAVVSKNYSGRLSPAIPANAVLVVESVIFSQIKPFDLVLYTVPNGEIHARRVVAKGADNVVVGYELDDTASADVAGNAVVGRIVATILYDPSSS